MPSKAQIKAREAFVRKYAKKKNITKAERDRRQKIVDKRAKEDAKKKKGSKPYSYIRNKGSMKEEMIRVPKMEQKRKRDYFKQRANVQTRHESDKLYEADRREWNRLTGYRKLTLMEWNRLQKLAKKKGW